MGLVKRGEIRQGEGDAMWQDSDCPEKKIMISLLKSKVKLHV